jgi:hypothetical protein
MATKKTTTKSEPSPVLPDEKIERKPNKSAQAQPESVVSPFILTPQQATEPATDIKDAYMEQIVSEIYSKKDIELKTDLNTKQIIAIAKAETYAGFYGSRLVANLCQTIMELSVSKDRKGRKEFTSIAQSIQSQPEEIEPTLKTRLLGE